MYNTEYSKEDVIRAIWRWDGTSYDESKRRFMREAFGFTDEEIEMYHTRTVTLYMKEIDYTGIVSRFQLRRWESIHEEMGLAETVISSNDDGEWTVVRVDTVNPETFRNAFTEPGDENYYTSTIKRNGNGFVFIYVAQN